MTAPRRAEAVQAVKTAAGHPQPGRSSAGTRSHTQKPNGRGPVRHRVHSARSSKLCPILVVLTGIPSHTRDTIAALARRTGRQAESGGRAVVVRRLQVRLPHADIVQLVMQ